MKINTIILSYSAALALLGICSVATAQNLFVGSYGGQNITEIPSGGSPGVFATGLGYPTGLAFDGSGDLFADDQFGGEIYEYKNTGGTLSSTPTTFASSLTQPNIMAFNNAGSLFVNINGTSIEEFTPGSGSSIYLSGLNGASGLAFDKNGDLFLALVNGGGSTSGTIQEYFAGGGSTTYASGLNYPVGLAFNAAGDLFVTGGNNADTITMITPGKIQSPYTASGLDQPTSIAFDNAGDMFVASQGSAGNGNITEFSPIGQETVYNSTISKPESLAFQGVALPVPEPTTFGLLGLGALAAFARYKHKKSNR